MKRISLFAIACLTALSAKAADIEISPKNGSLHEALREARELRRLNRIADDEPVRIRMRGGIYHLEEPVFIRPEDSGTESSPTIIEAMPDETPVLSGGLRITAWKKEGKYWVAQAPEANGYPFLFRQLWVNGRKAVKARNVSGFEQMDRIRFNDKDKQILWVPASSVSAIRKAENAELIIHQRWEIAVLRIKSITLQGDSAGISFHQPESRIQFEHPWPQPVMEENAHSAFYLTNALELLDEPGEWYFDRRKRKIYYLPLAGENMQTAEVYAPVMENLVEITGTLDRPVRHIRFKNIHFRHTGWNRPSEKGHVPLQTGMYLLDAYKLHPPGAPGNQNKGIENQAWIGRPPAAVTVSAANHTIFENCHFEHLGACALDFIYGTHYDNVEKCVFRDIAGNGIQTGKFSDTGMETHLSYDPSDEREICTHQRIANNYLTDTGNEDWGCVGIAAGFIQDVNIEHNEICEIPYTGVSVGWAWTKTVNCMKNNRIHANYIHHYARHNYDVAGIYTLSAQSKSEITENRIEAVYHPSYAHDPNHWFYIYTDEGSSFITIKDNWCPAEKFMQNTNGPGNSWENNGPMVSEKIKNQAGLINCQLILPHNPSPEIVFGTEKLKVALKDIGYRADREIIVKIDTLQNKYKEGYTIKTENKLSKTITITAHDASGALYACIDLAKKIKAEKQLPDDINISDHPEMVLRGACIGVQKPYYLPGRTVYEYPYTPETFPWFYDKDLWIEYLDQMVENKMNSLYLWNGHPFASLVKLKDYPYAVEVDDETFRKNEEIFAFLTEEAQKRGIWVIQMFYNIIVSKPFAEHHGIKTQDRSRPIDPLISDYTRKSIATFIEKYPKVGLLVCLGEAMDTYEDDVRWFTETILPGVKDGLKALGKTEEPPIVLRAHDTNCKMVMEASLPIYKNLYTMHKYNGESLTTYQPGDPWAQVHRELSSLGSIHISNVHIMANLEPFRYGSPDFIRKSVSAMHEIHGANALHLYPQASYWDYPYTADKTEPRLKEIKRNWIWYEAWARYAWNVHRDRNEEIDYWSTSFARFYGCGTQGGYILEACEQAGEIAPKLLRKFGITEGNRQTLLLGMFMSQLVNPAKWKVYPGFHSSCGPQGETLAEYMDKEWNRQAHVGETPPQLIAEAVAHGNAAVEAIEKAAPYVTANIDEFNRLKNDMYCYRTFAQSFAEKVKAAGKILRYARSNDIRDLEQAISHIEISLEYYRKLTALTKDRYLYANSMQTEQRRIPAGGNDGTNKTWEELLPLYEEELANFKKNVASLKQSGNKQKITPDNAGAGASDISGKVDWLFY
jgi:hypothetical protein